MKRKVLSLLLALCMLTGAALAAAKIVPQSDTFYVQDAANVLESETKQKIIDCNAALEQACGGQIVVVTIDFLNDLDSEEYAYEILNQWGVGDKQKNNGVVLLLVVGEAKGWVSVGAGIEKSLTAGKLNTMLENYFWEWVDAGKYDDAVNAMFDRLVAWFEDNYNFKIDALTGTSGYPSGAQAPVTANQKKDNTGAVVVLLLILIVVVILISRPRGPRAPHGRGPTIFWFGGPRMRPPRGPFGPFGPGPGGFGPGGPRPGGHSGGSRPGGGHSGGFGGGGRSGGFGGMGHGGGGMGHGGGAGRR